jgi:predicted NAD/FAD-binding protein
MNRLQRLDEVGATRTYVVTLNGEHAVDPATVIDRLSYEHPVYTADTVAARSRLPQLNDHVVAFAGAWQGWGFHEDGARSGADAARSLGVEW